MSATAAPLVPSGSDRYRRRLQLPRALGELWRARELTWSLAERELRARYSQAVLGFGWAVLTPLALMIVFTLFFKRVARVDTGEIPYPVFAYVGLVPWTFFSASVSLGGQSLLNNLALLNKVYCPREVFPLASLAVAALDSVIAVLVGGILFLVTGFAPVIGQNWGWLPLVLAVQVAFTAGVALTISSIVIYLRDLRHLIPIMLQLGLFATPVAYGFEAVPISVRRWYAMSNPLAPVIDAYRRIFLMNQGPDWDLLLPGLVTAMATLLLGYLLFKKLETGMADVA